MATSRAEREMAVLEKAAEIESKKNWWATGNSSLSREDQLKAQALNAAKESEKLKRYDELQAKKDALALATRNQDIQEATNEATLTNANAIQQSKNWNALQVANIRAGAVGAGKKDPSVLSANERTQAILKMQENGSAIGKPMSIEDAARQVDKISGGSTQVMRNADGTPVGTSAVDTLAAREKPTTVGASAADTLAAREKPTTVGMTAVDQLVAREKPTTVGTSAVGTLAAREKPTTVGMTAADELAQRRTNALTTALTDKQWQQYADSKSPGMQFVGNQPGMIGDQIARFKRADGSTFFANTGAAKMQLGDALTQTPATTPPLDNTPGSVPRATMPDAANRSAMNTKVPKPQSPSAFEPISSDATGLNRAGWNALIPKGFVNTNWTDASMAAGMTRDTGEEPSIQRPDNYDKAKALNDSLMQDLPAYTGTRPEIAVPAPETSKTQDLLNWFANAAVKHAKPLKEDPSNLLSWLKDRKKRYTASASH